MKEVNPFKVLAKMEEHYNELSHNYLGIETIQDFLSDELRKKAILFDLFQIGEQMNRLPKSFLRHLNQKDIVGLISIRNHIVHGYDQLDYDVIKKVIEKEIHPFLESIKQMAIIEYHKHLNSMLGKNVKVFIDRPKGYVHKGIFYELNYGYIKDIVAPDYEYQDGYIIDEDRAIESFCFGKVIAIIHRENDVEDKLVISINNKDYSVEEIERLVHFQEQFFKSKVTKTIIIL